jgi:hypothetical protein
MASGRAAMAIIAGYLKGISMRLVTSLPASLLVVAAAVGPAAADTAVEPAFAIMDNPPPTSRCRSRTSATA